jgi:hypothetical protein
MSRKIKQNSVTSSPIWETLEPYARAQVQRFIQQLLEEEVAELLGRERSERRALEEPVVYRNGYGKPRKLALLSGTITVQRPRVRGLEERLESRVLPLTVTTLTRLLPRTRWSRPCSDSGILAALTAF